MTAETATETAVAHPCRRCSGHGEIPRYQHVQGGVCFGCWGTKLDLITITAELRRNLEKLRDEYRQARRKGATGEVLKGIERRGHTARRAFDRQVAENQALRAQFQQTRH